MPEHIRALIVILFLAAFVFGFAQRSALTIISREEYVRWRTLWFSLTLVAFLSYNYWVYAVISFLFIRFNLQRDREHPLAFFFLLLYILPSAPIDIPGFGVINFLFTLTQFRLLELVILLPAYLYLRRQSDTQPFGTLLADKLFLGFQLLVAILMFRESNHVPWSFTNLMRDWFELFLDTFLPYYVASRSLKNLDHFKTALLAFVVVLMVQALIALFEFGKHWLLYSAVLGPLDLSWSYGYLGRAGSLRSSVAAGHSIILGYLMTIALGFYLFLQYYLGRSTTTTYSGEKITINDGGKFSRTAGLLLLLGGLLASLSRGPWVGAAVMFAAFIATSNRAIQRIFLWGLAILAMLPALSLFTFGQKLLNLLPFVGNIESGNVDYRERLLDNAIIVIERFPLFGSPNALDEPEMQSMIQGEGIIDLVNSYVEIALYNGLVSVALFILFFVAVTWGVYRAFHSLPKEEEELHLLGRSLFSVLIAVQLIIFTVSSIITVPIMYWSIAGIAVAYIIMVRKQHGERDEDNYDYWDETPSNTYR